MSSDKNWEVINFLAACSPESQKCINISSLLPAFQEIAYNILYSDLHLNESEVAALKEVKETVRKLANRKSTPLSPQLLKALLTPTFRLLNGGQV